MDKSIAEDRPKPYDIVQRPADTLETSQCGGSRVAQGEFDMREVITTADPNSTDRVTPDVVAAGQIWNLG